MVAQIYKTILDFKLRESNEYNLPLVYNFRYRHYEPLGLSRSGVTMVCRCLYLYILDNMVDHRLHEGDDIDALILKCCSIDLHPDKVGIARQHLHRYAGELVALNFLVRADERGYVYLVNPYYFNVLSSQLARHAVQQVVLLASRLSAQ